MEDKKNKIYLSAIIIFWLIFALFILNAFGIWFGALSGSFMHFASIPLMVLLLILGITLIVLTAKANFQKTLKAFFILTGSSAIGITVFGILHNLFFALLIKLFGEDFGARMGDEPVFFILATIICPLALLVGVIGSIVLIARKKVKIKI